tara:strand:- start:383 stop:772 length:390 start_codon:yes stop_codon:yes gene_type:complete
MCFKIPKNVIKILNGESVKNETILYENTNFILLVDPKNTKNSFHYTAWYKYEISSLKFVTFDILNQIIDFKNELIKNNIIDYKTIIFLHYPPQFYRLHIHLVDKNHKFNAPNEEIFFLENIYDFIKSKL